MDFRLNYRQGFIVTIILSLASPTLSSANEIGAPPCQQQNNCGKQLAYFESEEYKAEKSATIKRLSSSRDWLGSKIDGLDSSLDSFFIQKVFGEDGINQNLKANNKSRFYIESGPIERKGVETNVGLDVRLTLPNTKERLQFVVSSSSANDNRPGETLSELKTDDDDVFTGFQFFSNTIKKWRPTIKLGTKWGRSPEVFLEGRLRRHFGTPQHNLGLSQSVAYFSRRALINTSKLEYFKSLSEKWGVGFFNQARHFGRDEYWEFEHTPNLQQKISDRNAMYYLITAAGDNQQHPFIDSYTATIRWRRRIHSNWLFFDVEPSHTYFVAPHINNTPASEAALFFRLEMLINND